MTGAHALMALRAPQPGRVKTRLAATLGHEAALSLYRAFVSDELATLDASCLPVTVFVHPPESVGACREWLGRPCLPQRGADLGERMAAAFQWAFDAGAKAALLVGGDLPELSAAHLGAALAAIKNEGTALAPSLDGGYTLVAFTRAAFTPEAFRNIQWSTPMVLGQTLARLDAAGRHAHLLPDLPDMDTAEDLNALAERWRGRSAGPGRPARTLAVMRELGLFTEK